MVAAPFGYECVSSFEEAAQALQRRGEDAKVIAGGQSLVPMLNLRLARPAWLVDINPVGAGPIEDHGGYLRLPALTRHRARDFGMELLRVGTRRVPYAPVVERVTSDVGVGPPAVITRSLSRRSATTGSNTRCR